MYSGNYGKQIAGGNSVLPFFPTPYPEELLYSVLARLKARLNLKGSQTLANLIFGRIYVPAVDLPSHLSELMERLPPGHSYSVDEIIDEHTLLPYYAPFLPPDRYRQLRETMVHGKKKFSIAGIGQSRVLANLKYCPECVQEDRERWGEAYWHRIHQVPVARVCPRHGIFLCISRVRVRATQRDLVTAEEVLASGEGMALSSISDEQPLLLSLARDAERLLSQNRLIIGPEALRLLYIEALSDKGISDLKCLVAKRLSPALLEEVGCSSERMGQDVDWSSRFLAKPARFQSPARHLIIVQALGRSMKNLLIDSWRNQSSRAMDGPFGGGPWPCLNPAADHYTQLTIRRCDARKSGHGNVIGTFKCLCGFHYERSKPIGSSGDQSSRIRILSFGPVWDDQLKSLWNEPHVPKKEISRRLGVEKTAVIREACRLGLAWERPSNDTRASGDSSHPKSRENSPFDQASTFIALWDDPTVSLSQINRRFSLSYHRAIRLAAELGLSFPRPQRQSSQDVVTKRKKQRRQAWLKVSIGEGDTRKDLRQKHKRVYNYLWANDREWFLAHLPAPQLRGIRSEPWVERDNDWSRQVPKAAQELRSLEPPVKLSKHTIARRMGKEQVICSNLARLPKTARALEKEVETPEQYAIRRLSRATETLLQQGILPTYTLLYKMVRTSEAVYRHPSVVRALNRILAPGAEAAD